MTAIFLITCGIFVVMLHTTYTHRLTLLHVSKGIITDIEFIKAHRIGRVAVVRSQGQALSFQEWASEQKSQ